jgi:hypothetical protein
MMKDKTKFRFVSRFFSQGHRFDLSSSTILPTSNALSICGAKINRNRLGSVNAYSFIAALGQASIIAAHRRATLDHISMQIFKNLNET